MKVLWITNLLFPEAERMLTGEGELKTTGGWMLGAAEALLQKSNIELVVTTVSSEVNKLTRLQGEKIFYYVIPLGKGNFKVNLDYIPYWKQINQEVQPAVVHIHGTEYSHGLAYLKACGNKNVVLSLQGVISAISPYYCGGMTWKDIMRNLTFRDLLRGGIYSEQKKFAMRGVHEVEMIKSVLNIIGRTSWDRARAWVLNPNVKYHFCNEVLRREFYEGSIWNYQKCRKHSIFLSQAAYPVKGLHQVLKAMPLILRKYPDTIIRIAGYDITNCASFSMKLRLSGYGLYIKKLIKQYHLENRVVFTGNLNAEEMKNEYLNCNVFVCPSSIENSPNSLGEAQILGVPCLASFVGGIPDMMKGNEDNLFRFEEIAQLAEKICHVFSNLDVQVDMRKIALERHSREINTNTLLNIYNLIAENS